MLSINANLNSSRSWIPTLLVIGTIVGGLWTGTAHAIIVQNPSFEVSPWNQYNPSGYIAGVPGGLDPVTIDNWTYYRVDTAEGVGLGTPGNPPNWYTLSGSLPAGNGTQFAFVQKTGSVNPSIAQDVVLSAGNYLVNYWVASRTQDTGLETYQVQLNGSTLLNGSLNGGSDWTPVSTFVSVPTSGTYALKFFNTTTASGNHTFLLDNVEIVQIPEPSTLLLLGVGGLLAFRLRARSC